MVLEVPGSTPGGHPIFLARGSYLIGPSPSGKAQAFDACSRWFESNWPCLYETLAQSVEHLTFNQVVAGSIPACLIPFFIRDFADVAELADAPDLGSGGRPCRFKSCHPHE